MISSYKEMDWWYDIVYYWSAYNMTCNNLPTGSGISRGFIWLNLSQFKSLNFYIHDILEDGVSSNNRIDSQAKSLGEYLRAKLIKIPSSLIKEKNNDW